MLVHHVVARSRTNHGIGINGAIPWRIKKDLAHFRRITHGYHIVMGRKTHESIGKVLPGRPNIIVSRSGDYAGDLYESLELLRRDGISQVFIIGGAEIYEQTMDIVDYIHLTEVDLEPSGCDVFYKFPEEQFCELYSQDCWEDDVKFQFKLLRRAKNAV